MLNKGGELYTIIVQFKVAESIPSLITKVTLWLPISLEVGVIINWLVPNEFFLYVILDKGGETLIKVKVRLA